MVAAETYKTAAAAAFAKARAAEPVLVKQAIAGTVCGDCLAIARELVQVPSNPSILGKGR